MNRRPQLELIAPAASPAEAAAIVAALEQFMRETAPLPAPPAPSEDRWRLAALHESVNRAERASIGWAGGARRGGFD